MDKHKYENDPDPPYPVRDFMEEVGFRRPSRPFDQEAVFDLVKMHMRLTPGLNRAINPGAVKGLINAAELRPGVSSLAAEETRGDIATFGGMLELCADVLGAMRMDLGRDLKLVEDAAREAHEQGMAILEDIVRIARELRAARGQWRELQEAIGQMKEAAKAVSLTGPVIAGLARTTRAAKDLEGAVAAGSIQAIRRLVNP